jgi:parallel beta-helix repeat protein
MRRSGKSLTRTLGCVAVVMLLLATLPASVLAGESTLRVTGNTTLTEDFAGSIVIAKNGVTLDCAGHRIIGTGTGRGISVDKRLGVTVRNCDVLGFSVGFWVTSTSGSTFEGNNSHGNLVPGGGDASWVAGAGFWFQSVSENRILNNNSYNNEGDGFDAFNASANLIAGNTASNDLAGFFLGDNVKGNTLEANTATSNRAYGYVLTGRASDNVLVGNVATDNGYSGFELASVKAVTGTHLDDNTATGSPYGFLLWGGATDNSLTNNTATANLNGGFALAGASSNHLVGNNGSANLRFGFAVTADAASNTLSENVACNNPVWDAIQLEPNLGNVWTDNEFCTTSGIPTP